MGSVDLNAHETARAPGDQRNESRDPPLRGQVAIGALIVALTMGLLAAFGLIGGVLDVPFAVFTKEIAEQFDVASYTGFLAHITWFMWVIAGTAGLLSAAVLRRTDPSDRRIHFFVAASVLTAVLLLDDFAMLHEQWLPRIGIPEEALYVFYAVILAALLLWFRPQFVQGGALLAAAAGAFWAASLGADFVQEQWGVHAHAVEDGAKMIGTALWSTFMVWSSLRCLSARPEKTPARIDPSS
jgi:hypothetical protein